MYAGLLLNFVVWRVPRILVLRFYLLVFLTLLTLFSYCANLVGGSVLQLVQDLMEPKPIVTQIRYPADEQLNLGKVFENSQKHATDLLSSSSKHLPWFLPGYEGTEKMFYFLNERNYRTAAIHQQHSSVSGAFPKAEIYLHFLTKTF